MSLLTTGTGVTLLGILSELPAAAIAGTAIAGIGYGASGLASFGAMARLAGPASPAERGALFAVAYTVAFLAFSLPAVAAGYATAHLGLRTTVAAYSVLVIGTALAAFAIHLARHRRLAHHRPA
jgi:MFS family permease